MTFFSRAAAIATLTFSLTALLATSTPGVAAELAQTVPMVESAEYNISTPLPVPVLPVDDTTTAPVEAPEVEAAEFASLDAAVAAQSDTTADETLRCLAGAIYYEAKGEPLSGQLAVAEVILNRSKSGRFPANICSVVTQRGQFSFVRGGVIPAIDATRTAWKRAVAVARVALNDVWDSPASEALYFNTAARRPGARVVRIAAIGNHIFYR